LHREVQTLPAYALQVKQPGRVGPSLKPATLDCQVLFNTRVALPKECALTREQRYGTTLQRWAGPIDALILRYVQPEVRKLVVDATGLDGLFAWEIAAAAPSAARPDIPNIFTALEDQLGLRLVETTAPYEVIVIDDVRMPSPN
jgi:uncharacterized protein (TIGR03435 family)